MSNHFRLQTKSRSTLKHITVIGAAFTLIALSAIPVAAAGGSPLCGSRPDILKQLSKRYSEEPVAAGISSDGSLIEILTSDSGSTWTIMISQPNGPSCLIAAGEGWEELKSVAKGDRGA